MSSSRPAPRPATQKPTRAASRRQLRHVRDRAPEATTRATATKRAVAPTAPTIRITSPDRVVFARPRVTKQQVADYYAAVMPWFLPEVQGRPLSVVRCPEGVASGCFFQKHVTPGMHRVGSVRLREASGKHDNYLYVEDADSVMELVQFGIIEFHPWGARVDDTERADRMVFDLDPGAGVAWPRVIAAARLLRDLLAKRGLQSFPRTSGGKGLHVVVPLAPAERWPVVKEFAQKLAAEVADRYPKAFLDTASKALRDKRIFIDWLRNARGATSVASYSLRARAGAPVAMPLAWGELGRLRNAHGFDIVATPRRLARRRREPWPGFTGLRQSLASLHEQPSNDKRRKPG